MKNHDPLLDTTSVKRLTTCLHLTEIQRLAAAGERLTFPLTCFSELHFIYMLALSELAQLKSPCRLPAG